MTKLRKVCFIGLAGWDSPFQEIPADAEIWAANESYLRLDQRLPTRVFQMHPRDWREAERRYLYGGTLPPGCDPDCFGRNQAHVEFLRTCEVPVYCQALWPDIPTCVVYPFERVRQTVGIQLPPNGHQRLWATSTFGYMAALLLTEDLDAILESQPLVGELHLVGVELPRGTWRERTWEWPNLAYYLGMATGLGITIRLPSTGSSLLSAPHYALDGRPNPGDPDHWHHHGQGYIVSDRHPDRPVLHLGSKRDFEEIDFAVRLRDMPVELLGLSSRLCGRLRRSGITTVGQIVEMTDRELRGLRGFGQKSLQEVRERMALFGSVLAHGIDQASDG